MKDLQKEYHQIRDLAGKVDFLLANREVNKRFVNKNLFEVGKKVAEEITCHYELIKKSKGIVGDAEFLYQAYVSFCRLSERQKTKRGGFPGFVRSQCENDLWERIETLTRREVDIIDSFFGTYFRTFRINYKEILEGERRKLNKLEEYLGRLLNCQKRLS